MEGWISLHRQFLEWEWYNDNSTMKLFIHILLKANHKKKNWKGIVINTGQLLTGRKRLSYETKLSEQQIRTSLKKLISTNEITIKATNLYSLISITNWNKYQSNNQRIPSKQPTSNQQVTTTNNDNNDNKEEVFSFKKSLLELGIEKQIVSDWLKVRAKKKASNTDTAFKGLKTEIKKTGLSANECIKKAVENSWAGFSSEWLNKTKPLNHPSILPEKERNYDKF